MKNWEFRILCLTLVLITGALSGFAGVSREIQGQYKKQYENKAMFLKIPIYSEKQMIHISGQSFRVEPGSGSPRYKVGDQLRVLAIDFGGDEIKFRLGGIATAGFVDIGFKFDGNLQENFPNKDVFDRALRATLTEGLKYTDIDDAKTSFIQEQFDRAVREIAGSASINKESVLKTIAPQVPDYQDAQRDIESLRNKIQDISAQLSQSQVENRKLEAESRAQQAELSRQKNANAALQEKLEGYTSQLSKLGDQVRDAKGNAQGYQRELANLQRSLNLRVDSNRDLTVQITDIGQALKKLQKENETSANQITSLRTNLDAQQAANARLVGDNEEVKAANRNLQSKIADLTSKDDSLVKRYYDLGNEKEKLEDYAQTFNALRTRIVEEKTDGGFYQGKANIYVKNILLGSLTWSIPVYLNRGENRNAEASFSAESIDYVRVTPEERHILKSSLGDKLKIRLDLASGSESMNVKPDQDPQTREVGERDHSTWKWSIENRATQDAPLILTARLINKNSNEISFFQQERSVSASNMVRRIRGYLQPIPVATGIIIGFLLFGIVGIFRRPKNRTDQHKNPPAHPSESISPMEKKQL
jgi:predicted nuclease with TOPRIM domain